jgi:hypothetical protein
VAPAIAERNAAHHQPVRPDRPQRLEQQLQDRRCLQPAAGGPRGEDVVESARTGPVGRREQVRPREHLRSEAAEQGGAALEPGQGVVVINLEASGESAGVQPGEIGEGPGLEQPLARHGQALGTGEGRAGRGIGEAPAGASAGVEQHGDDDQVERGARPLRRLGRVGKRRLSGHEMAPAGVERDGEVRVALASHRGGELRRGGEPCKIDRPALDLSPDGKVEHFVRALANRRRAEQGAERFGGAGHAL